MGLPGHSLHSNLLLHQSLFLYQQHQSMVAAAKTMIGKHRLDVCVDTHMAVRVKTHSAFKLHTIAAEWLFNTDNQSITALFADCV